MRAAMAAWRGWGRRRQIAVATVAAVASAYTYDREVQASAAVRTARALWTVAAISVDYKINFRAERGAAELEVVHARAAERVVECCRANGGLFVKFGQTMAVQGALLPSAWRRALQALYDDVSAASAQAAAVVVERALRQPLDAVFAEFSEAVASASVAQVHRARLRCGRSVAVKVQKPEIARQIAWDLFALRTCTRAIEWAFGIPLAWTVSEVECRVREELDFAREGHNSERARRELGQDPWLRDAVYIPRVEWEATAREVLTTEWIDGISLVRPAQLERAGWDLRDVMGRLASLFAFQIFCGGSVHGDPHPGNVLVRPNPARPSEPQLVLLDHGLYVREPLEFRRQYAEFWRAAVVGDAQAMQRIARAWGMADVGMLATMVTLRPGLDPEMLLASPRSDADKGPSFDRHMELKARAVGALRDAHRLPAPLVFVTRNMNIVRAHNQSMGVPVDRVGILGRYAARGLRSIRMADALSPARRYVRRVGVDPARDAPLRRAAAVVAAECGYVAFRGALWLAAAAVALHGLYARICARLSGRSLAREDTAAADDALSRALEKRLGYRIDASILRA